ncbi:biotin transporter BioY [Bacillus sp. 03113]|uniref:biotin transporter BioY n=1 Tax=Bacillus sp. 03113 TaxID=2578211 RepID=UPI001144D13C|nr:biotin transporter BioY [Bacillus sp. 03113]
MKIKNMVYVSLFSAIMAVLGLVPPIFLSFTPVPITLQTLGVLLSGSLLGPRLGALSQALFLLLVAVGLPILSGGRGGFEVFLSPSAGYLLSYPIAAFVIGLIVSKVEAFTFWKAFVIHIIGGILIIYSLGVPVQALIMKISILQTVKLSLVYLPGDFIKIVIASFLAVKLSRVSPARTFLYNKKSEGRPA